MNEVACYHIRIDVYFMYLKANVSNIHTDYLDEPHNMLHLSACKWRKLFKQETFLEKPLCTKSAYCFFIRIYKAEDLTLHLS